MLHLFEPEVDFRSVFPGPPPDQILLPPHSSSFFAQGIRISEMRNDAAFPSFPSPFLFSSSSSTTTTTTTTNNLGETEAYIANSDVAAAELERVYGSGFYLNSQHPNDFQLRNFPSPALPATAGVSHVFSCMPGDGLRNTTKHDVNLIKTETTVDVRKHETTGDPIGNRTAMKDSKRRKTMPTEELNSQPPKESPATQPLKAPVKRSQKLGDKVTALQQLVSPFGKTDTASVLHEATLYIKVLQEQIQVLSTPYFGVKSSPCWQGKEEKFDLSSRGLCLVPIESTINLTREFFSDQCASSRTTKKTVPPL